MFGENGTSSIKKLISIAAFPTVILIFAFGMSFIANTPLARARRLIGEPLPKSFVPVRRLMNDYDNTTIDAFIIDPNEFSALFKHREWRPVKTWGNIDYEKPARNAWPDFAGPMEYYSAGDEYPSVELAVSADHSKIIALFFY